MPHENWGRLVMGFWWRVLGIDIVVMGCRNTLAQELPIVAEMQSLSDYDSPDEFDGLHPIDEESADGMGVD